MCRPNATPLEVYANARIYRIEAIVVVDLYNFSGFFSVGLHVFLFIKKEKNVSKVCFYTNSDATLVCDRVCPQHAAYQSGNRALIVTILQFLQGMSISHLNLRHWSTYSNSTWSRTKRLKKKNSNRWIVQTWRRRGEQTLPNMLIFWIRVIFHITDNEVCLWG